MAMADARGITVGLGSDVGAGPSLSMLREMANACFASKARSALEEEARSRLGEFREEFARLPGGLALYQRVLERLGLGGPVRVVTPEQALYMATLGGARALGAGDETGSLEPGKWADFVVIDLRPVDPAFGETARTPEEVLSQIVFRADSRAVVATYAGGRAVYSSGTAPDHCRPRPPHPVSRLLPSA